MDARLEKRRAAHFPGIEMGEPLYTTLPVDAGETRHLLSARSGGVLVNPVVNPNRSALPQAFQIFEMGLHLDPGFIFWPRITLRRKKYRVWSRNIQEIPDFFLAFCMQECFRVEVDGSSNYIVIRKTRKNMTLKLRHVFEREGEGHANARRGQQPHQD
jgi:hypothetical protein